MRQRHSQGYGSSGDDLEDDACSRLAPAPQPLHRGRTWIEMVENILWIGSVAFIVYFGDRHSNLIYLMWHDGRIRRVPLYLGMVAIGLNIVIFFSMGMLAWSARRFGEKWELVILCSLADLGFLNSSSSVYSLHGLHGCLPQSHDRVFETSKQCAPDRLEGVSSRQRCEKDGNVFQDIAYEALQKDKVDSLKAWISLLLHQLSAIELSSTRVSHLLLMSLYFHHVRPKSSENPTDGSVVFVSVAAGSCMPKDYTGSSIWFNRLSSYLFDSYRKLRLVIRETCAGWYLLYRKRKVNKCIRLSVA